MSFPKIDALGVIWGFKTCFSSSDHVMISLLRSHGKSSLRLDLPGVKKNAVELRSDKFLNIFYSPGNLDQRNGVK